MNMTEAVTQKDCSLLNSLNPYTSSREDCSVLVNTVCVCVCVCVCVSLFVPVRISEQTMAISRNGGWGSGISGSTEPKINLQHNNVSKKASCTASPLRIHRGRNDYSNSNELGRKV